LLAVGDRRNMVDKKYESLKCELVPVDDEKTLALINKFVKNTHGKTHHIKLKVGDVFEIAREGEKDAFETKQDLGNVRLLWHGSRLTNFVGILSQGLRIAPPAAPVSGYMFGKGVYFADMVSKSANYCHAYLSDGHGLMILCEVALGEMNPKYAADYNAGNLPSGKSSTHGIGRTYPKEEEFETIEIDGVQVLVPCGTQEENSKVNSSLMYNEFIVYDTAQVRMKYLIRMKFN
jgi:poly [ADP-ribose] polymerase